MANRKTTKKYYFTVEGETEQWYLKWLEELINATAEATYKVSFDCPIQKNPLKRAKSMTITRRTDIYHLSDYESDDPIHVKEFMNTMDNMKAAKNSGKQITYKFGYSNLTFDLWMILHKNDCNSGLAHRSQYITHINRAFCESFEDMHQYKKEKNFKRCLSKLQLSDVRCAINRAKNIMETNENNGYILHQYKGFKYYKENPSLMIWEPIENILKDCGIIE